MAGFAACHFFDHMKLYHEFKQILQRYNLLSKGDVVILGVSGGLDSVVLLHLFVEVQRDFDLKLVIAHVNYKTRGTASDADEASVRSYAKKLGLPIEVLILKPKESEGNFEEWARDKRYEFFEKVRTESSGAVIAVAHHQHDQAETILMNFLKGAGITGLSGMAYKKERLIRPLLGFSKEDLRSYATHHNLDYHEDATNTDQALLRNRIRHELIPRLEGLYNPNIIDTITRMGETFRDLDSYVVDQAKIFMQKYSQIDNKRVLLNRDAFLKLPRVLQREVLHASLVHLGLVLPLSSRHFSEIQKMLERNVTGKKKELDGSITLCITPDALEIRRRD